MHHYHCWQRLSKCPLAALLVGVLHARLLCRLRCDHALYPDCTAICPAARNCPRQRSMRNTRLTPHRKEAQ